MGNKMYITLTVAIAVLLFVYIFMHYSNSPECQPSAGTSVTMEADTAKDKDSETARQVDTKHGNDDGADIPDYEYHHRPAAYMDGFSRGYNVGEMDAVNGNGWRGRYDDSNNLEVEKADEYEEGYRAGYESGYNDYSHTKKTDER